MAEIRWTIEAETWLKNIYDYIAQDDPGAAARVVEGIYGRAQLLKEYPEIGHKYRSEPEGEIRILLYGHYRIAYLIAGNEQIDIFGSTVVASNAKGVLICCGAIQILAPSRPFRAIRKYPTAWPARSVVTFRCQQSGRNNSGPHFPPAGWPGAESQGI